MNTALMTGFWFACGCLLASVALILLACGCAVAWGILKVCIIQPLRGYERR
jgi:hypothetical protein